ncbi:Imm26 family immunity protein [Pasteurellaceae bacterium LIM206]|nr:Imm26 family immunity protein [Pasteurellaceae bacterium LIM206]
MEVFNYIGGLQAPLEEITASGLMFRPIAISGLEIYKKRWVKIGQQENYDKEKDSNFSQIQLVLPALPDGLPRLWQNGQERHTSFEESKNYEEWTIWRSSHLEKRIIETLKTRGVEL